MQKELEDTKAVLNEKTKYQIKALFIKNFIIQKRQKFTNIIQILVPIFGLILLVFLREAVIQNTEVFLNDENISLPIPFFYNMPLKPFRSFDAFTFFNVTECEEWYLFQFNENTTT